MMDLEQLDTKSGAELGYEFELRHPETGAGLGMFITVLGADSDAYRGLERQHQRDFMQQFAKSRKFTKTPEQGEADAIELLVAVTRAWRTGEAPTLTLRGEALACTPAHARRVYREFPVIREQAQEAVSERANFLPRPAKP